MNIEQQVLPGTTPTVFAKDQPEYRPLPAICYPENPQSPVTSRWSFTDEERKLIAEGADIYLTILTFRNLLQPILMQVFGCQREAEATLFRQGYIPAREEAK